MGFSIFRKAHTVLLYGFLLSADKGQVVYFHKALPILLIRIGLVGVARSSYPTPALILNSYTSSLNINYKL
jgi:hypothetical protein